ncbi:DHHW family protein [Hydrogenoanaerobacterium sp.]|uniref:DHHW family protein n=1 Tax=Hydrogenoanaerobacterium sp. TaxID=2953763 RepID=UPI00289D2C73|nr:DHHW family protein [Hydrogenoanaerobacterium sp.]
MDKIFFRILAPLWGAVVLINLILPNKNFSESENRYLASFPSFSTKALLNGKYMQGMDEFFNDHFVARDSWIAMQSSLEYSLGKRENNGVFVCKNALMADIDAPKDDAVQANIRGIKAFVQRYQKPSYLMLVPSAAAIQTDKLPLFAQTWDQAGFVSRVASELGNAVKPVELFGTLTEHKDNDIYYRTDHHWTSAGTFLAYQQACKVMGLVPKAAEDFQIDTVSDSFYGTLYSKSGVRNITPDTIQAYHSGKVTGFSVYDGKKTTDYASMYFDEYLSQKDKYSYFLGSNQPLVTIHTASKSGKRLLIFKDSYAHSLAPFFVNDYSEIALVDMRYISGSLTDITDPADYDDVLFVYSVDVFAQQNHLVKLEQQPS